MIRIFSYLFFVCVLIILIASYMWTAYLFQDCMASGKRAYQCSMVIENGRYYAYENMPLNKQD